MQYIVKGQANTLIITGTEKVSITTPKYLLVFVSQMTQETKAFIVTDISTKPARWNEFQFTEGSTMQKTLGIGTHYWTLYAQSSNSNINPDLADEEIDSGIAQVSAAHTDDNEHEVNTTIKQHHIG